MSLRVLQVPYDDGRVQELVAQVQREYVERYGSHDESPLDPADFAPPRGRFFVVTRDDRPLAMGGWRPGPALDDLGATRVAEVKRMFVSTDARRTGLARVVLRTLEDSAREAGCDVLAMETGLKQPEAIALYESAGYVRVTSFGHYAWSPLSRYYGRRLDVPKEQAGSFRHSRAFPRSDCPEGLPAATTVRGLDELDRRPSRPQATPTCE